MSSPSFINAAVVTAESKWILFHQTKYAVGVQFHSNSLAPVGTRRIFDLIIDCALSKGGLLEPNEDALAAAKREVLEETGFVQMFLLAAESCALFDRYEAADSDWHSLGACVADANRGCGIGHMFVAFNAKLKGKTESGAVI